MHFDGDILFVEVKTKEDRKAQIDVLIALVQFWNNSLFLGKFLRLNRKLIFMCEGAS